MLNWRANRRQSRWNRIQDLVSCVVLSDVAFGSRSNEHNSKDTHVLGTVVYDSVDEFILFFEFVHFIAPFQSAIVTLFRCIAELWKRF